MAAHQLRPGFLPGTGPWMQRVPVPKLGEDLWLLPRDVLPAHISGGGQRGGFNTTWAARSAATVLALEQRSVGGFLV